MLAFLVLVGFMLGKCEIAEADWAVEYYHDSNAGTTEFNGGLDRVCGRYFYESGASWGVCPIMSVGSNVDTGSVEVSFAQTFGPHFEYSLQLDYWKEEMYGGFSVRRLVGDGPFKAIIGGSYWNDESPGSDSDFTFNLGLRYIFE